MNSDTQRNPWPRVRRVLEEALEHPTRLRSACVEEACGSDLALRAEVEHLLTFEPTAESLFDAPLTGAARVRHGPFQRSARLDLRPIHG